MVAPDGGTAVKRNVRHVDFMLIDREAPLAVDVPLNLVGESPKLEAMKELGVTHGGPNNDAETLFDGVTFDPAKPAPTVVPQIEPL